MKLALDDIISKCNDLLNEYQAMLKLTKEFETVVNNHKNLLQDSIMDAAELIIDNINSELTEVNDYIRAFTEKKQSIIEDIKAIETSQSAKVSKK